MLVLTDHATHSSENSIYGLLQELRKHPLCAGVDTASRSMAKNTLFFSLQQRTLYVAPVDEGFSFRPDGYFFKARLRLASLREYDVVLLRLPPPVSGDFWQYLSRIYPEKQFINQPSGIRETSNKLFLLQVPELCPPIRHCINAADILAFKDQFPIVLKPLHNYGGKGILKVEGDKVWSGTQSEPLTRFLKHLDEAPTEYLAMKFLKNVAQGDKRVIVLNGQILGASIRLPAKGNWMCNVAQGGYAILSKPGPDDQHIADTLSPLLADKGVIFYGFDTLVDDDGRRILSEINTMSVGGLVQIANFTGKPLVKEAAHLIWEYVKNTMYGRSTFVA